MTKLTDASKANKSGEELERKVMDFLVEKNIPFKRQKPRQPEIDFIIDNRIYADCTNQNVEGSVQDKIPHKIWKYYKKYGYKEVYIIRGFRIPDKGVIQHCDEIAEKFNFKWHLVTFGEFCEILGHERPKSALQGLENFIIEEEENERT